MYIVHYLDDYLFCGKCGTAQCNHIMQTFQDLTGELGVPLAEENTEGPCTKLIYLGWSSILFNSIADWQRNS